MRRAEIAARGHGADEDAGVGVVGLHADAVAQNRAAGIGAAGVNGDDADGLAFGAQQPCELIGQRAFARAGWAGDTEHQRAAGMREERGEQFARSG